MPRVIGAVDGSLIPIRAPYNNEHMYVCHNGFHAINAMAVCNAKLSYTNFVCSWQGSVHDLAVFNDSMLHAHLEKGGGQNGWLLGDRGYGMEHCNLILIAVAYHYHHCCAAQHVHL